MKTLLTLLLLYGSAFAQVQQHGIFPGTKYYTFSPTGSGWTSMGSWRLEFRASNLAGTTANQGLFGNNNDAHCVIPANSFVLRCRSYQNTSSYADISLAGRTDIRVRFQRVESLGLMITEVWNADGSNYATASSPYTPGIYDGRRVNYIGAYYGTDSIASVRLGFVRLYSTTKVAGQPAPPDSASTPADLLDVEFEGSVVDSSPVASTLTLSPDGAGIEFGTEQLYPPVAAFTVATTRAGNIVAIDGSTSTDLSSESAMQYFWTCVAGPTTCDFVSRTTQTAQLNSLLSGTYTVRLRVTNASGLSHTVDEEVGVVSTDASNVVILPNEKLELLIGPLLRSGASQWPGFDTTELQVGSAIAVSITDTPGDTPLVGTTTFTNGSTAVTGSGTTFQSTFACNGTDLVMIHYPLVGGGTGRRVQTVMSCSSNTAMVIDRAYDASEGTATGVSYGKTTNVETSYWINGSNNWNYYDAVVAYYRLYYRTGIERYRTEARSLADKWYKWPFDGGRAWINGQGYWQQQPRMMNLLGLMLRAEDGKPEYWPSIVAAGNTVYVQWVQNWFPSATSGTVGDVREQGYASLFQAGIAVMHPDSAVRSTALVNATAAYNSYWKIAQLPDGSWRFPINVGLFYSGDGTLPWQAGFTATYLTLLHRISNNSEVLDSLQSFADFMNSYGVDPLNDGGYYDVFYTRCPAYERESQGTVAVTAGSTTVTGSGTSFLSRYGCNGTDRIAVDMASGNRVAYTVASCASDTTLTLAAPHSDITDSGRRHLLFPSSGPTHGCGVCVWGTCGGFGTDSAAKTAARTLLNASHTYWGYLYAKGKGTGYKTVGDNLFAKNLGFGGLGGDGITGDYKQVVSGGSAPAYLASTYRSKEFAFVGGAAGAQPYLAWRQGEPQTVLPITLAIGFTLGAVPNATKARITMTKANGAVSTLTCVTSPCVFTGDRRETVHQFVVEYLSSGDKVLATSDKTRVVVP
jgi:hypothetical protein